MERVGEVLVRTAGTPWGAVKKAAQKDVYQTAVAEALCSNRSPKECIRQLWLRPYAPTGAQRSVSDSCG